MSFSSQSIVIGIRLGGRDSNAAIMARGRLGPD